MQICYGDDEDPASIPVGTNRLLCPHDDEELGQPKFIGILDAFAFAWYLTTQQVVMVCVGCQHKELGDALEYWEGKEDREEIYAACEWLAGLAKKRDWKLHMGTRIEIDTAKLIKLSAQLREDGLDGLADEVDEMMAEGEPITVVEEKVPLPPEPPTKKLPVPTRRGRK